VNSIFIPDFPLTLPLSPDSGGEGKGEGGGERAQIIGSAGDGGMAGFGIRGGHVSAIRKTDGPRSYYLERGSETTSETGPNRFEISQKDETVTGANLLNCIIAGLTPNPNPSVLGNADIRDIGELYDSAKSFYLPHKPIICGIENLAR
jgi:hypothetical protein